FETYRPCKRATIATPCVGIVLDCRRHLEKSLFPPVRDVTFLGSWVAAFPGCGLKGCRLGVARGAPNRASATPRRPCSGLSDLEDVIALATPSRRLGRARHVQLLLFLGDISQHRTEPLVLHN